MRVRLDHFDSDLANWCRTASDQQRRRAALAASEYAVAQTGLDDPLIREAIAAARSGAIGDEALREKLNTLIAELDERYFDLKDAWEDGGAAEESEYLHAFALARAANAVSYLLSPDAFAAVTESLYEAKAATDDLSGLRRVVRDAVDSQST